MPHTGTPTVTAAHIREVLDSPAESPALHLTHDGRLDVDPAAHVHHDQIILTREEIIDYFNGDTSQATDADLDELVDDAQAKADEIHAAQGELDALDSD